jgi:hypothetical protein
VLANLALDGLERRLREKYPLRGPGSWQGILARVHLIRYADDFVITGKSKELLEDEVEPLVESFLRECGLELSAKKDGCHACRSGLRLPRSERAPVQRQSQTGMPGVFCTS